MTAPTPASDFDLEGEILDAYGASIVLANLVEVKFGPKNMERDGMGFQVFRLNDQEVMALHYISAAVRRHTRGLYYGFLGEDAAEAT